MSNNAPLGVMPAGKDAAVVMLHCLHESFDVGHLALRGEAMAK